MERSEIRVSAGLLPRTARAAPAEALNLDRHIKRLADIAAALPGLLFLSPLFLLIAVLIKRDSPGPVFYRGQRVGKGGSSFSILKFRTMEETPESRRGSVVTAEDDPRVTRIGRWLRRTKLNELPQLWNVLTGEMSLVGPRPEAPELVASWPEEARREVLSVRPGITSPASVLYRDEERLLRSQTVLDTYLGSVMPTKLRLDQLYVRHRTIWLDLDTLLWTALVLLPMAKNSSPAEDVLFFGPIRRFARRHLSWFLIDSFVTFVAIGAAGVIWRLSGPLDVGWVPALIVALAFALLFSVIGVVFGMDRISWSHALASDSLGLVLSAAVASAVALLANRIVSGSQLLPPTMILFASFLALSGFIASRYRYRLLSGLLSQWLDRLGSVHAAKERVLIVGGGRTGQFVSWLLNGGSRVGLFRVVGFVDDDLYKQGFRYHGVGVIGRRTDIPRLVARHDVGVIVFAIHNISNAERNRVLSICGGTAARLVMVPDIVGALNAAVAEKLGRNNGGDPATQADKDHREPLFTPQGIPPVQAQLWLSDLEAAVESGDLGKVGDTVCAIRERLQKYAVGQ